VYIQAIMVLTDFIRSTGNVFCFILNRSCCIFSSVMVPIIMLRFYLNDAQKFKYHRQSAS